MPVERLLYRPAEAADAIGVCRRPDVRVDCER